MFRGERKWEQRREKVGAEQREERTQRRDKHNTGTGGAIIMAGAKTQVDAEIVVAAKEEGGEFFCFLTVVLF